ncbi:hypothetical protein [Nesterenkonia pannonica]|uniref:hypothetical protein n=1 Tax=Nesterenkonia pannonica TaxID=1548602 RepID=UPI0021640889|nr:hypothetical protein [Nesterenkonia pannonica]
MAGWALLLDYLFLPMINFMVIGLYLNAALPQLPVWLIIIVTIVLVTAMNVLGIKVAAGLNSALVGIQAVFIVVFAVMSFAAVSGYAEPISPLSRSATPTSNSPRSLPVRPSCACRSWDSTPSPLSPRRRATPPRRSLAPS